MTPEEAAAGGDDAAAPARSGETTWAGSRPGARADAVILDAPSYTHLVYRPGVPLVGAVVMAGQVVRLELAD